MHRQKLNPHKLTRVKTRYHKVLFDKNKPFGHRVERDRFKQIPRKDKYKDINIEEEE